MVSKRSLFGLYRSVFGRSCLPMSITERQRHVNHPVLFAFLQWQAAALEHLQHRQVLGEHVGLEMGNALVASDTYQAPQQAGGDAASLEVLFDCERDMRARPLPRVLTQSDDGFLSAALAPWQPEPRRACRHIQ